MKKKYIAIVDPFVDSQRLAQAFNERDIHCIAILSNASSAADLAEMRRINRYNPEHFAKQFFLVNNFDHVVMELKKLNVIGIITGFEDGVLATDKLNQTLSLPYANPSSTSIARFNKFETNHLAKRKGINAAQQIKICINDLKENKVLIDKINKGIKFPVVIKPTQSGGSFGVRFCNNMAETTQALSELVSAYDSFFAKTHHEFVIQEQLIGSEFVVDIVSFFGKHYLAGINSYCKKEVDRRPIYQAFSWVDPNSEVAQNIINYIYKVLDAINFNYGPSHVEVFLTAEGPKLVEVNPRVSGASGFHNKMCALVTGRDQIDLLADLYVFNKVNDNHFPKNKVNLSSRVVCLCNLYEPAPLNFAAINKIKSKASYQQIKLLNLEKYPKTIDMHTLIGFVLLAHENPTQLEDDYSSIIKIQNEELF